jgi:hypothetical protein
LVGYGILGRFHDALKVGRIFANGFGPKIERDMNSVDEFYPIRSSQFDDTIFIFKA